MMFSVHDGKTAMNITRIVRSLFINRLFTFQSFVAPADQVKRAMIGCIYREETLRFLGGISAVIISRTPELIDLRLFRISSPAPEVNAGQWLSVAA